MERAVREGTLERVLPAWSLTPIPVWVMSPKGRMRLERVARVVDVLGRVVAGIA